MQAAATQNIITPIIHLNGTSKAMLIEELSRAYDAIQSAFYAMGRAAPNGRDYYPEPGRMEKALEQHTRRMKTLSALMDEIETEISMIGGVSR